jgi:hypothetical protein
MTADRWNQVNTLLEQALDLDAEGRKWLVDSCPDPEIRSELARLLAGEPEARELSITAWSERGEQTGAGTPERVGPYRVTSRAWARAAWARSTGRVRDDGQYPPRSGRQGDQVRSPNAGWP